MSSKCPPSAVARVRIGHSRASTYLSGQACEILLDILSAAPTTNMCSIGEPCVRAQDVFVHENAGGFSRGPVEKSFYEEV